MDKKVFTMALLTIFSAFILIIVIIYATNVDKINGLFGKSSDNAAPSETSSELSLEDAGYAQQIGNDLNGFMYDDSFFDETEEIPAVVVIQQKKSSDTGSSEGSSVEQQDSRGSAGTAVIGELENPDTLPDMPGVGLSGSVPPQGNIPPGQTVSGTPVGNIP